MFTIAGTIKEEHQVRLWRRLINFEKTNPQRLDPAGLRARVTFTYNQCLLCLYHYPDMWLEFANYQVCPNIFPSIFCVVYGFSHYFIFIYYLFYDKTPWSGFSLKKIYDQ